MKSRRLLGMKLRVIKVEALVGEPLILGIDEGLGGIASMIFAINSLPLELKWRSCD